MSENSNEEQDGPRAFGFAVPASAVFEHMHAHQDHHDMENATMAQRINALFDSLDVEQLVTLRRMFAMDGRSGMNNYFEGQIVTMLRRVHNVDPESGLTMEEALALADAQRKATTNPE